MSDVQSLALFVIVLAAFGLYLQSQGKFGPVLTAVTDPVDATAKSINLGHFVIAFLVFLFVTSFFSAKNSMLMTVVIVLGALLVNNQKMGSGDLLHTLFPGGKV